MLILSADRLLVDLLHLCRCMSLCAECYDNLCGADMLMSKRYLLVEESLSTTPFQ